MFQCPGPHGQADTQHASYEKEGVWFSPSERDLNQKKNNKRKSKQDAVMHFHWQRPIETARAKIHGDRADYAHGVKAG